MSAKKITAFNEFMKVTVPKIKAEKPEMKHTDAFKAAAELWTTNKNKK